MKMTDIKNDRFVISAIILMIMLSFSGCSKQLGRVIDGEIIIDVCKEFDPLSVLIDLEDGTDVSYELDLQNSILILTLSNGKKTETYEVPVTIKEPYYKIADKVLFDLEKGFDIGSFVEVLEGTSIDCELDSENKIAKITLTNGLWSKYFEIPLVIVGDEKNDSGDSDHSYYGNADDSSEELPIVPGDNSTGSTGGNEDNSSSGNNDDSNGNETEEKIDDGKNDDPGSPELPIIP